MIKTRVIPTLLYKNYTLVKGIRFDSWRRVGSLLQSIMVYNMREVDELLFLDITATLEGRSPGFNLVDDFADDCFMPLTVGGGVKTIDDIKNLLRVGADKVAINSSAFSNPDIISEGARKFGSQCIVVSIDAKKDTHGNYKVCTHSGTVMTDRDPASFAKETERLGAGEILLTSVDRDGVMEGYDIELVKSVTDAVSIPVIASGGAGRPEDTLGPIVEGKASAVAAASMFHFTHITPLDVKFFLKEHGVEVRI